MTITTKHRTENSTDLHNQTVIHNDLKGTTDLGFLEYNVTGACTRKYNVTVKCVDNTVCGSDIYQVNVNNQSDGTEFDCTKCNGVPDLHIDEKDVSVFDQSGTKNITVIVHNDAGAVSNVNVRIFGIDRNNQLVFQQDATIASFNSYAEAQTSITQDLSTTYFLNIQVDPDNAIHEDKTDNVVQVRPDDFFKPKVALKIFTGSPSDDKVLYDHMIQFFQNVSESDTDIIYSIGNPKTNPEFAKYNQYTFGNLKWGMNLNGLGRDPPSISTLTYIGIYGDLYLDGMMRHFLFGNEREGNIAVVKRVTEQRDLVKERWLRTAPKYVPLQKKPIKVTRTTPVGYQTAAYMDNQKQKKSFATKNDYMSRKYSKNAVRGRYEVPRKQIFNAQAGIQLQTKELKPDTTIRNLSTVKNIPVILARGLWSDLNTWKNLGQELAKTGRDVWLIEITGGPNQDCVGRAVDNCPDYTFADLTDDYFPTLIGKVQQRTGSTKYDYVGFSNGCRTAISAYEKGTVNPSDVDTMVLAGCPGAFEGLSEAKLLFKLKGETVVKNLRDAGLKHVGLFQAARAGFSPNYIRDGSVTISVNLFNQYTQWAKSTLDKQPGQGIFINNFNVIYGLFSSITESDLAVTLEDNEAIFDNVNANVGKLMAITAPHYAPNELGIPDLERTRHLIIWRVNNDTSQDFFKNLLYVQRSKP